MRKFQYFKLYCRTSGEPTGFSSVAYGDEIRTAMLCFQGDDHFRLGKSDVAYYVSRGRGSGAMFCGVETSVVRTGFMACGMPWPTEQGGDPGVNICGTLEEISDYFDGMPIDRMLEILSMFLVAKDVFLEKSYNAAKVSDALGASHKDEWIRYFSQATYLISAACDLRLAQIGKKDGFNIMSTHRRDAVGTTPCMMEYSDHRVPFQIVPPKFWRLDDWRAEVRPWRMVEQRFLAHVSGDRIDYGYQLDLNDVMVTSNDDGHGGIAGRAEAPAETPAERVVAISVGEGCARSRHLAKMAMYLVARTIRYCGGEYYLVVNDDGEEISVSRDEAISRVTASS